MDPRGSLHVYPRFDSDYRKKRSLNYDMMKTEIFQNRKMTRCVTLHRWFVNFLIGVAVGMTAFGMSHLEEWLID